MRIYQCSGHLFTVTQRKASVIKHRCLFSFHTQLILLAGVRAESRDGRTAAVVFKKALHTTLLFTFLLDAAVLRRPLMLLVTSLSTVKNATSCFKIEFQTEQLSFL